MTGPKIAISKLRPTQMTLGLDEVASRAAKIADMDASDIEALLHRKPIPYVLGPRRQIYIVDHHHLARALWSLHISEAVLGDRLADWSDKEPKEFWQAMDSKHYCWPYDAEGNRRPYAAIPTSIVDLTDNIWRTLGRRLRGKAFDDHDTPYQEFMWGDYFRTFMSRRLIELEFDLAMELAEKLARLPEAQDLPGYLG
ncbi:ParB-like protein [uncultured Rhodoblastus sp.]|uniref:ParB-like protein n=1 Tax=uncultured Rhodoblastus sp. TaxID=543037 RepID=UPI0026007CCB|nr:ParB-like protein [uncultured Rhodoblastus sp.]